MKPFGRLALLFDIALQRLIGGRLEVHERQFLEFVLHLAHAETVGDGRVDVSRLLGDAPAPFFGQVPEGPHVVQPVGQFDEDDADVIHHGHEHLAEALRLPLLARRELQTRQLGDALDHVRDPFAEQVPNPLDGVRRVFDDVVEEARGDGDHVQAHVREDFGHLQRVDDIRLAGAAGLVLVLGGRERIGPLEQIDVRVGVDPTNFFDEIAEPDHLSRCLKPIELGGYEQSPKPFALMILESGRVPGNLAGKDVGGLKPSLDAVFWGSLY